MSMAYLAYTKRVTKKLFSLQKVTKKLASYLMYISL